MASSVLYGLKVMIPWSELNLQLCGESSIAQEALLKVIALRPHLIITDIRIPQKNGLELIDGVRKLDITTEFVILSGYPDFLCLEAMRNRVVHPFILPFCYHALAGQISCKKATLIILIISSFI